MPESFKKSYRARMDSEFWRLQIREELGGTPAPSTINWAMGEMVLGSNAPIHMYAAGAPSPVSSTTTATSETSASPRSWSIASGAAPWC
ncbi:hypothetical protein [Nocardioides sp. B-3]|uniref:hypothetical protein n=1 Tax=Nocardioides sp. B-3 TaxID=2895565 RepID=UPI0021523C7C|nr:hypothetical protein [Nocardioides sp. B-3]UUZ61952.1 hypothetical protein LP418_12600 [Nocardioides sp. B-3]